MFVEVMFIICQFRTMAEITRYLNMEKIVHLPPNPGIFKDNLKPGQFDDTWLAALECLVDYIKLERGRYHRNDRPELVENYIICTCQKIHFQNKTMRLQFSPDST